MIKFSINKQIKAQMQVKWVSGFVCYYPTRYFTQKQNNLVLYSTDVLNLSHYNRELFDCVRMWIQTTVAEHNQQIASILVSQNVQ